MLSNNTPVVCYPPALDRACILAMQQNGVKCCARPMAP